MSDYGRRLVLLVFLGLSLCVKAEPGDRLSILLTPSDNLLHVKWILGSPVQAIRFSSTPFHFVHDQWKPVIGVFDYQLIDLVFDAPVQEIGAEIRVESDLVYGGFYTPFVNFDQGMAIYQGHYLPAALKTEGLWRDISTFDVDLQIEPVAGKSVVLPSGDKPRENLHVADKYRNYALLVEAGSEVGQQRVLLDSELPDWLYSLYKAQLPVLLNYFREYFETSLDEDPFVLVGYQQSADETRIDGGVVGGQLVINVVGDGWHKTSPGLHLKAITLLAHEVSHLWNANLASEDWLIEGGANFLAQETLLSLGLISAQLYEQRRSDQISRCKALMGEAHINELSRRADHYVCGESFFYWLQGIGPDRVRELWLKLAKFRNESRLIKELMADVLRDDPALIHASMCLLYGDRCETPNLRPAQVFLPSHK
ncbi:hypothetical protein [Simiduia agarivorans]|uniref:Peptidase M61 catalytic domain-containing protein n=1 Tax=Simiduia agarivorans (strain DSM 21679 / JCM 13881 / BCRC 17597 / SA1) TaxID=1117647 RepID=K4KL08_SIMAS|nr:hypothetical protein [Simiduia agarivorans]AFU98728.2 hypothetical protein M5M_07685 [Simiduia agarivorans SA1 = DSM 21679]